MILSHFTALRASLLWKRFEFRREANRANLPSKSKTWLTFCFSTSLILNMERHKIWLTHLLSLNSERFRFCGSRHVKCSRTE